MVAVLAAGVAAGIAVAMLTRGGANQTPSGLGGSGAGSCAATVEWKGTSYFGSQLQRTATLAQRLGTGTLPACADAAGSGTPARSVAIVAVEGIPPDEAVAIAGEPSTLYVEPGYLPQLPHTVLHDLLYGPNANLPNERGDCQQATTADVQARVQSASFGMLHVTLLESTKLPRDNYIFPDAHTVFTGGGKKPHVAPGDVVRANVLVCRRKDDPHFLKLVASSLSLGGPGRG